MNDTTQHELVITRTYNAPRELVFKMWTQTEHLARWWGPKGFEMDIANLDLKPGGKFHYRMHGNGMQMWGLFIYREIKEPEKLVFVNSFSDEQGGIIRSPYSPLWPLEILNTLTLEDENGSTKMTLAGAPINATEEEMQMFRNSISQMQQGFSGPFEQLDAYLKTL